MPLTQPDHVRDGNLHEWQVRRCGGLATAPCLLQAPAPESGEYASHSLLSRVISGIYGCSKKKKKLDVHSLKTQDINELPVLSFFPEFP